MNALISGNHEPIVADLSHAKDQMRRDGQGLVRNDVASDVKRVHGVARAKRFVGQNSDCGANLFPLKANGTALLPEANDRGKSKRGAREEIETEAGHFSVGRT